MLNLKLRKKRLNPSAGYRIFSASISETVMLSSDEKVLSIPNKTERTDTHTIAAISIAIINFFTLKFFTFPFSFVMFFPFRLQPIKTRSVVGRSFTFFLIGQRLSPPPTRLRGFPSHRARLRFPHFSLLSPYTLPQLRRPLPKFPRLLPHILRRACPQP